MIFRGISSSGSCFQLILAVKDKIQAFKGDFKDFPKVAICDALHECIMPLRKWVIEMRKIIYVLYSKPFQNSRDRGFWLKKMDDVTIEWHVLMLD